jgi:membrane protein
MFETFAIPISWTELLKRTARETLADDCLGLAAQLAYYFFLALFPALLFLLALASLFPIENLSGRMVATLQHVAPPDILNLLREQIARIAATEGGGLLTFGLLGALWSSSAALVSIVSSLNRAYDLEEERPWWKVRLIAIGLTIALACFILVSFALVLAGPMLADWIAERFGLGELFAWTWKIVQWPIAIVLIATAIGLVYYFAPDAEQDWAWVTPGAAVATLLWLIASLGFKIYVSRFSTYNETYGAIGGVIVLLLWFYLTGLAILVGAEMNAEIEHASPHGKDPGEKVPGQRRKIGLAAARAWTERAQGRPTPAPEGRRAPATPAPRPAAAAGRPSAGGYIVGTSLLLARLWARLRGRRSPVA